MIADRWRALRAQQCQWEIRCEETGDTHGGWVGAVAAAWAVSCEAKGVGRAVAWGARGGK